MSEAVTDVIVSRSRESDGLTTMIVWSVAIHAVLIAGMLVMPQGDVDEGPRTVMTISLGGSPGPKTEGMNQMGGRSVQAVAPPEAKPIVTPPAPQRPKMTLPDPRSKPRAVERPRPTQAPAESTARTVSTGAEITEGSTKANAQIRGQGFGLSQGGGFGGGIEVKGDFCCPEYLAEVRDRIQRNYVSRQNFTGMTRMEFTLQRDGTLTDIKVDRSSGFEVLDRASRRALELTQRVPRLPAQYTNPTLTVYLFFEYRN